MIIDIFYAENAESFNFKLAGGTTSPIIIIEVQIVQRTIPMLGVKCSRN
jgi:hypothetical protein